MWSRFFDLNAKRQHLLEKCPAGALHDFYSIPFVDRKAQVNNVPFVVLDFETTGLAIMNDHVLSIGLIEIKNLGIKLESAWHDIIKTDRTLPEETTVIHQITDDMLLQGLDVKDMLDRILSRLKGHVLIAHHAQIELGFLNRLCIDIYNTEFLVPAIDTQLLAQRQLKRDQEIVHENSLRLFKLRERYKLPIYKAHNALSDAMSTAEIFLALLADLYPGKNCLIKDLAIKC